MYAKRMEKESDEFQEDPNELDLTQLTQVTLTDLPLQDQGDNYDPLLKQYPYSQTTQQQTKGSAPTTQAYFQKGMQTGSNYPQFTAPQQNQGYFSSQPYTAMGGNSKSTQSNNYSTLPKNTFNDIQMPLNKESLPQRSKQKNYYNQKITGATSPILKTPLVGSKEMDVYEFDDYFEKHADKFFTPELDEIRIYSTPDYLLGIQFCYRDSWGKDERETYNGNLHMNKQYNPKQIPFASLKLDFDELVKEIYVEGSAYITHLKFVTNKKQVLEFGYPSGAELKNLLPDLTNLVAVGGSYCSCISNIYFSYS